MIRPRLPFRSRSHKVGLPPGTLATPEKLRSEVDEPVQLTLIDYGPEGYEEKTATDVPDWSSYRSSDSITWINVDGLQDTELLERIGTQFGLHPLVLEDVATAGQRPKLEDYGEYLYLILYMLQVDPGSEQVRHEQMSVVLGDGFVISFQETPGDVFDPVRTRIRNGRGRIRTSGSDYLAYALMDTIVDHYFVVAEAFSDEIEELEDRLLDESGDDIPVAINQLRRELMYVRRSIWPLREVISLLQRSDSELVSSDIRPFLRDIYDHTIQVVDVVETYREISSSLLDLHLSQVSNRMNEVMQVLTIIGTIFIPLTFVAGIYGMNFEYMPELAWPWAYPALLVLMLTLALSLVVYFRRREWI